MQVEGITVQKIIEPKLLGVFKAHNVYLCTGKYGEYLRHNSVNYSIPEWAKMENLKERLSSQAHASEPFGIAQASNIIDWKMKNPRVPRGEAVCKPIEDPILLGVHNGHDVWLCNGKYGEYLRYNSLNYSIPEWARKEKLNEMFNLTHAINIIDWKMQNKVPKN